MTEPGSPTPGGGTALEDRPADLQDLTTEWVCLVWDDPVNLMSYVTHVFSSYFHYERQKAERLMLQVHTEGKAAVASGSREEMERDCNAMHSYGLWATLERA